ncbi:pyrroline-5-carboxylate reductase [Catalinimonas alkaloidigena]|uniref:pyrroline-5-carboxylate reductase n=1 Tax=Catalinimonas alkaloidigena TaxID=1075417 RepID=UPI002406F9DD|nr:pyrroline-5-carboxylate reductase [Catalinimonas alkaloidigena]MDF9797730.1 pyrroline-5-carboxylate reductase [Catalinimonas alkaloidigena]
MSKKIAILGGGNLGQSIALGLISTGNYNHGDVIVTRRKIHGVDDLLQKGVDVITDNVKAVTQSELVFLCVQPKQLHSLLDQIKSVLSAQQHVLISTITGVAIEEIEARVGDNFPIIRAMPNTAIAIRESMTCMATRKATESQLESVQAIFNVMGRTLVIEEELMAAATVLGASGIAFALRFIRAAAQGGIEMGFDADEAQAIAMQTCRGAASLLIESGRHPESEIDRVTTPRGCTIAGLNEMEHNGLSSALIKGIVASHKKIANIKKQVS